MPPKIREMVADSKARPWAELDYDRGKPHQLDYGYTLSCDKAQGSEWRRVTARGRKQAGTGSIGSPTRSM